MERAQLLAAEQQNQLELQKEKELTEGLKAIEASRRREERESVGCVKYGF